MLGIGMMKSQTNGNGLPRIYLMRAFQPKSGRLIFTDLTVDGPAADRVLIESSCDTERSVVLLVRRNRSG